MKYVLASTIRISVYTEVHAESLQAAMGKAAERQVISLCYSCASGEPTREWVTSGDLDGCPQEERLTSVLVGDEELSKRKLAEANRMWR